MLEMSPILGCCDDELVLHGEKSERRLGSSLGLPVQTLLEPEGVRFKLYNMAAVGQAVQEGRGEPGRLRPGKRRLRGHREWGLRIIDVSHPASLREVGFLDTPAAVGVFVQGSYAYVSDASWGLSIVRVSDMGP